MKALRWLIIFAASLFVLIALAVVLLVNFVNPNDYREKINQVISEKIHKPFAIEGELNWTLFPSLGLKAQNTAIGSPDNTKDLYAHLDTLEINLRIWPLLHKQIALNAVSIDGVQLVLANQAPTDNTITQPKNPLLMLAALPQLSLGEISIKNASVEQKDNDNHLIWSITNATFYGADLRLDETFPVQTAFELNMLEKKRVANITFATKIKMETTARTITLTKPELTIDGHEGGGLSGKLTLAIKKVFFDDRQDQLSIQNFSGAFNQLNYEGNITVNHVRSAPNVTGALLLTTDHLRALLNSLINNIPPMQSPLALTHLKIHTNIQYSNNKLTLDPFVMQLDQTHIAGTITSPDVKNLALHIALQSPLLPLSDYLAKESDAKKITLFHTAIDASLLPPLSGDNNWLESSINSTVRIQNISDGSQNFQNILLQLDAKNKIFKIIQFHTGVWQGTVNATGVVNLQGSLPKFTLNPQIHHVQLGDLLQMIAPKANITGLTDVTGTISSEGLDVASINSNLMGNVKVMVKNGVLHGVDVGYWLKAADAALHKQPLPPQPALAETTFSQLTASLMINEGVIHNQDLLVQGPVAQITGQGSVDLGRELLDYHLQLAKTNEKTGKAHSDIVPLFITGSFDHPSIKLDLMTLMKQLVGKEINKEKDRVQQVLANSLTKTPVGQQLSSALGKLLG